MSISLNPKDAIKGGIIGDVDATIIEIKFDTHFTYPNSNTQTCAAVAKLQLDGGDIVDPVFWSVGKPEDYTVSDDGMELESVKGNTGASDNSNYIMFATELINAGFPANKLTNRIDVLVGLRAHWIQKAQPKRAGIVQTNERDRTLLVPERVLSLPGEKNAANKGGTKQTKNSGTTAPTTTATVPANDMENTDAMQLAGEALTFLKTNKAGAMIDATKWQPTALAALASIPEYKTIDLLSKAAATRLMRNADFLAIHDVTLDTAGVKIPAA